MTRAQIQLPDELYQRAKAFAAQRELSLAEVSIPGSQGSDRIGNLLEDDGFN